MDFPLLAGLPEAEVRAVLQTARRRTFAAGEVVFHERDPAETLHLLRSGRLAVQRTTALGKTVTLQVKVSGDVVGEMALIGDDQRRSATVVALEPAETLSIHRDAFDELRRRQPAVTEVLVRILVERCRRLGEELTEALYDPADVRVRRRLLQMSEIFRGAGDREPRAARGGFAGHRATRTRIDRGSRPVRHPQARGLTLRSPNPAPRRTQDAPVGDGLRSGRTAS